MISSPVRPKVAAAVLSFSRLETLKDLVASLRSQTRPPDEIIVVYQGVRDDIWSWLGEQHDLTIHRQENFGSAGGFSKCLALSMDRMHDWVWIIDDDAVPELNALEVLVKSKYLNSIDTGFISSRIVSPSGITYMSPIPADANSWFGNVLKDGCVQVVEGTWLGLLVSRHAILHCGLPIDEYFLWDEDREYTNRISSYFNCYCALNSVIVHYQSSDFNPMRSGDSIKYNYWVRNRVFTLLSKNKSKLKALLKIASWSLRVLGEVIHRRARPSALLFLIYGIIFFRPVRKKYLPSRSADR